MRNLKYYCKDYKNIENYEAAKKDNFVGWCCHHRLETHNSDGERREVNISAAELEALGMYWNRPASELIFMKESEHKSLHWKGNQYPKGKKQSEETKKKRSEALKGKPKSEEHRKNLSIALKGKKQSEEHRRKNSECHKGQTPWNKGKKMPNDFRKKISEVNKGRKRTKETKQKMSEALKGKMKGMCWYNNGDKCIRAKECPDGFTPGRLHK